ncbi:hypothetical protein Q2T40_07455 [Winogradskyella maritima]|uniref:Uncharacterized protein n=1 Tax=Winogradskyella maritima TaxID=1517766 RepID=A0ABV8AK00_9FLAO|nr:hypothetical protein [Winogradskyella maritima]
MSNDYQNPAFKKLLQKLQEESWQLELLISGFAILGLFTAYPYLDVASTEANYEDKTLLQIVLMVALVSCSILILNLILHVLLRGLWIGALGLRYVSGDIDYEVLNYGRKFTKFLKKKVGSFDRYIATLENYCSVIFAISFLLIFYVLSFAFTIGFIALIINFLLDDEGILGEAGVYVGIPLMLFIVFGMFLTFIDFITQGWLKKKNWISRIYFPIYWVFSFITLSFLYRPIVYNFLDNKFGRRLSFALVPLYILILVGTSYTYQKSNYFRFDENSSKIVANARNYEDQLVDDDDFIKDVAISSKVVSNNYLKVFLLFDESIENDLYRFNPELKPSEDGRGIRSQMSFTNNDNWRETMTLRPIYMKTLNDVYTIQIDSTDYESQFVVSQSVKKQNGFETYVGIKDLPEGKHLLKILEKRIKKQDTNKYIYKNIPFWYFPD